jgi:Cu(I)/Ag(I) efflux system membrane fusion protein
LMLRLFPEDAATIRYGQTVSAEVQSLPGRRFTGRVAFIDPTVDRKTRTVGVRVVLPNEHGLLRVGDYAKATIEVPVSKSGDAAGPIYDPALANKWISPRHPHVIESSPGKCRICGIDLVPASRLGFTDKPIPSRTALFVPRDAVLMAGANSVVYVETESGRFQIRKVVVGPSDGDQIVILKGVKEGEEVASSGNFLIDSQMQLTGNPSLIDPVKAGRASDDSIPTPADLSPADRALAEKQRFCPVTDAPLGSMGVPRKVDVNGTPVFICCEGCRKRLLEEPERYLAKLTTDPGEEKEQREVAQVPVPPIAPVTPLARESDLPRTESPCLADDDAKEIAEALAKLSPADRRLAERQRVCPVADVPLGSMGVPIKVTVRGTPVFICCEGCRNRLLASPEQYLAKVRGGEER